MEGECKTYLGEVNDHTWEVADLHKCAEGGKFKLAWEGTDYILKQFHLHSPSEHTIGGKSFDAETHFVFVPAANTAGTGPVIIVILEGSSSADNAVLASL
jgi:carbonic anhydrase